MSLVVSVVGIPGHRVEIAGVSSDCSRSAGVFPFSLAWQTVSLVCYAAEHFTESLCIVPRNLFDRQIVAFEIRRIVVGAHHCFPLSLSDFVLANVKIRHGHLTLRT